MEIEYIFLVINYSATLSLHHLGGVIATLGPGVVMRYRSSHKSLHASLRVLVSGMVRWCRLCQTLGTFAWVVRKEADTLVELLKGLERHGVQGITKRGHYAEERSLKKEETTVRQKNMNPDGVIWAAGSSHGW